MVNWKNPESTERLMTALLAAHPGLKLDYKAIATMFGEGASYYSVERQFCRYRKMADDLKNEALENGTTDIPRGGKSKYNVSTPRTPRGSRGGITKASSSSGKDKKEGGVITPTKGGTGRNKNAKNCVSVMDAIFLDDAILSGDDVDVKVKDEVKDEELFGIDEKEISTVTASALSPASVKTEERKVEHQFGILGSYPLAA